MDNEEGKMKEKKNQNCGCSCCNGSKQIISDETEAHETLGVEKKEISRGTFLKVIGLGALGLSTVVGTKAFAAAEKNKNVKIIKGKEDRLVIDYANKEVRFSTTVTKDSSQPSVIDWGRRFQAFIGSKGGKMEPYFVFTTDVSRTDIDKAIKELGIKSRRQIPMEEVEKRKGLKPTTTKDDYLQGDPMIVTIRFEKDGKIVETALEDLIDEKIQVANSEVIKPWTPHFVYHGTAEAINFLSGCIVCPSDCNGGIITDNVLPLKHTVNYYKVMWDRMPAVGSKAEVVLKSIYGDYPKLKS